MSILCQSEARAVAFVSLDRRAYTRPIFKVGGNFEQSADGAAG